MPTPEPIVLSDWLAALETTQGGAIVLGLDNVRQVAERLRVVEFACPVVMVGGTNGKGSTVATLVWLLRSQGISVGSYTSPHLLYFQERIQINGIPVSDQDLSAALSEVAAARGDIALTYFEWTTLAALWLFKRHAEPLDVLVLEVGLGGRLDAVNVIDPTIAVVTSIGYDHQAWLGESLESIAAEKAGIFRPSIPVVIGKNVTQTALLKQAEALGVTLLREGRDFDADLSHQWRCGDRLIAIPSHGLPPSSVSLALATYTILEKQLDIVPLEDPASALAGLCMAGRFFTCRVQHKTIICDVAHNAEGAAWLADRLAHEGFSEVVAVWASLEDKALAAIVGAMKSTVKHWMIGEFTQPVARAASSGVLNEALIQTGITAVDIYKTIEQAFAAAMRSTADTIVVFGSFYTVAEVMTAMGFMAGPMPHHGIMPAQIPMQWGTSVTREGYRDHG